MLAYITNKHSTILLLVLCLHLQECVGLKHFTYILVILPGTLKHKFESYSLICTVRVM